MLFDPDRHFSGHPALACSVHKQFRRLPLRDLGRHAQLHARPLLQNVHDAEKILRAWIAVRGEHAVKALARLVDFRREAFKANGGIHQVAQDRLARTGVARPDKR